MASVVSGVLISSEEVQNPWWLAAWLAPVPLLAVVFAGPRYEASWLAMIAALVGCVSTTIY
jgi:hypothetical protein